MRLPRQFLLPFLASCLVVGVAALSLLAHRSLTIVAVVESWAADWVQALFEPYAPRNSDIVLLSVDEDALARFPFRSPIDRGFLADVLDILAARNVKAVGLDLLFDQPTIHDADAKFLAAVHRFPAPLVVGWGDRSTPLTERQFAFQTTFLAGIRAAFVDLYRDREDGTVREAFPGRYEAGIWRSSFSGALAEALEAASIKEPFRVHYRLGPDLETPPFLEVPIIGVKFMKPELLAGKIVLIGADLPFEDRFRTPRAAGWGTQRGTLPGLLIHAHVLAQLLAHERGPRTSLPTEIATAILLGLAAIGIARSERTAAELLLAASGVILALWAGIAILYWQLGIIVPVIAPSLAFAVGLFASVAYLGYRRRLESEFVQTAFSRYVSPIVLKRLENNPERLALGGENRGVTVIFTDIEGFTNFAEGREPSVIVDLLNRYFDRLSETIQTSGGMVDKYLGDGIMAVFGAPDPNTDHAKLALECAEKMRDAAAELQKEFAAQKLPVGRTRIGVHSGTAIVGNVGGTLRFDYTAVGDVVNTASRLEGANKYFHTEICASGITCSLAGSVRYRPLGSLVLKGRQEALPVFTPVGSMDERQREAYTQSYELMAAGEPSASPAFASYAAEYPDDFLGQMHRKRLLEGERSDLIVLEGK